MRRIVALLALFAVVAVSARAHAVAKSVTLLGVSGAGGERFADLVEQDLAELYDFVAGDVYRITAERLDKRGASPSEVQAVARALRIDAIIGGAITGVGRERVLAIAVRDGGTGHVVARARYDLSGQTLPRVREKVVSDLVRALERVRGVHVAAPAIAAQEEEEAPEPAASVEPVATARAPRTPAPTRRGVTAGVGLSLFGRRLGFDVGSAPGYHGGTVVGIRADGAVFPLALSAELAEAHPVLASFGIVASYERSLGLSSSTAAASVSGRASRWMAVFVGRIPLGHGARGGHLTLETGLQELSWSSDSPINLGVPDAKYDLVDAGLSWEHDLGTQRVSLALRAAYLGLVSSSGISSDSEYGRATGWGIEASATLTVRPTRWLFLRLDARYTPVVLSFAANGTRYARSATDQWTSGMLEVGFAL